MEEKAGKRKLPERSRADIAHSVVKAGLSAIPVAGGAAAELFSALFSQPIEHRKAKWMEGVATELQELEEKIEGLRIEDLPQNQSFVTTVFHASQAAIRTHQEEKLEALRNAVLNSSMPGAPSDDQQLIFLNYVDQFTPRHLRILKFFRDPRAWGRDHSISYPSWTLGAPSRVLESTFEELVGQREFYDQIVKDLYSRGLMNTESLHTSMTEDGMFAARITATGDNFIRFITSPIPDS